MASTAVAEFLSRAFGPGTDEDFSRYLPDEIPESMQDPSRQPHDDWSPWRAIPSTVTDGELSRVESRLGVSFPPPSCDFLRGFHFLDLEVAGLRFESHVPGTSIRRMKAQL